MHRKAGEIGVALAEGGYALIAAEVEDFSEAAPTPASALRGQIWPAALVRRHDETEAAVTEAQRQAAANADEKQQELESLRAKAVREGREAGKAEGAAAWLRLRDSDARKCSSTTEHALVISRHCAERLLSRELEFSPAAIVDLVRVAVKAYVRARRVVLYVNPIDAELLRQHLGELGFYEAAIDVRADPSRPRGGLRGETDLGTFDADIAPQLDRLIDALRRP